MHQYFQNRKLAVTAQFNNLRHVDIKDYIFSNEKLDDNGKIQDSTIKNSTFSEIGLKNSKISQCDFSFCVFIDCYFKNTEIKRVNFTGCKFINCIFSGSKLTFENCDFKYAIFENCYIPYDKMKENLPPEEENLRSALCRNLSIQCSLQGDYDNYKLYLFEDRKAGEVHEIRKLFHKTGSYYDKKFNFLEGIAGLFNFLRSKISKHLWGYGERMTTLVRNIILIIALFGILYFTIPNCIQIENHTTSISFPNAIFLSITSFFNVSSNVLFLGCWGKVLWITENVFGVILIGFFITALFKRINRK